MDVETAGQMPAWAVYFLIAITGALVMVLWGVFSKRFDRLETRVDDMTAKQSVMVEEQKHEDDMRELQTKMHNDFEKLQSQIAESNRTVHSRLDDLHVVLLQMFNHNKDA